MSKPVFDNYNNRLLIFERFLKVKFPKKELFDITKDELLSLTKNDFEKIKIGLGVPGSPATFYSWYCKTRPEGQSTIYKIFQDLGYAKSYSINENMCKKAARNKITDSRSVFNKLSARKLVFKLFLKAKFPGKKPSEITKEDLLSLSGRDFQNFKLGKNAPGSPSRLYTQYAESRSKGQNILYTLFQDLGYAKAHGINEDMCKKASRDKTTNAKSVFKDLSARKKVFELFLKAKFPGKKPSEITKEDLLSLGRKDLQNIKLGKNALGSPSSLYIWYSITPSKGQNTIYKIFQDLGYAKAHGINEDMCKKAGRDKTTNAKSVFKDLSARKKVFELFLKAKFPGKKPSEITKEDLLSLSGKDFRIKLGKNAPGSSSSLYKQYCKTRPEGQNVVYALLQDLGYSSFFKNEQDYLDSRREFLASNDNGKNLVIISHKNTGTANSSGFEALPDVTSFSICPDTKDVQIILSTTVLTNGEAKTKGKPVLDQLAAKIWPGIPMLTERKACHEMPSIPIGAEVLIHSNQPLDSIYQAALGAMGFEISFLNRQLKTDNMEINRQLNGVITGLMRTGEQTVQVPKIAFANQLNPQKVAANITGAFFRVAGKSETPDAARHFFDEGLNWWIKVGDEKVFTDRFDSKTNELFSKIIPLEKDKMNTFSFPADWKPKPLEEAEPKLAIILKKMEAGANKQLIRAKERMQRS